MALAWVTFRNGKNLIRKAKKILNAGIAFSKKGRHGLLPKKHFSLSANPARVIAGSFLGVIITGTLLLMLPLSAEKRIGHQFF